MWEGLGGLREGGPIGAIPGVGEQAESTGGIRGTGWICVGVRGDPGGFAKIGGEGEKLMGSIEGVWGDQELFFTTYSPTNLRPHLSCPSPH